LSTNCKNDVPSYFHKKFMKGNLKLCEEITFAEDKSCFRSRWGISRRGTVRNKKESKIVDPIEERRSSRSRTAPSVSPTSWSSSLPSGVHHSVHSYVQWTQPHYLLPPSQHGQENNFPIHHNTLPSCSHNSYHSYPPAHQNDSYYNHEDCHGGAQQMTDLTTYYHTCHYEDTNPSAETMTPYYQNHNSYHGDAALEETTRNNMSNWQDDNHTITSGHTQYATHETARDHSNFCSEQDFNGSTTPI